jgi:hypothetical protein
VTNYQGAGNIGSGIPNEAMFDDLGVISTETSGTFGFNSATLAFQDYPSLGDNSIEQLFSQRAKPIARVELAVGETGDLATVSLQDDVAGPSIIRQTGSLFTTTQNNDGTVNIWDDGAKIVLENKRGNPQAFLLLASVGSE